VQLLLATLLLNGWDLIPPFFCHCQSFRSRQVPVLKLPQDTVPWVKLAACVKKYIGHTYQIYTYIIGERAKQDTIRCKEWKSEIYVYVIAQVGVKFVLEIS